jgi:hypothetical protein
MMLMNMASELMSRQWAKMAGRAGEEGVSYSVFLSIPFSIPVGLRSNLVFQSTTLRTEKKKGSDSPIPITTKNPVRNRPKSTIAVPALSMKSSGFAQRPQIQLGRGAMQ